MALRVLRLSPLYRARPHPHLILMGWCAEPDPDGPPGPGHSLGLHQFLDTVLPQDPGVHRLRDGRAGDRQLPQMFLAAMVNAVIEPTPINLHEEVRRRLGLDVPEDEGVTGAHDREINDATD